MTSSQSEAGISLADQSQAGAGEEAVIRVVTGAMVDCRRDSLWQKLLQVSKYSIQQQETIFGLFKLCTLSFVTRGGQHPFQILPRKSYEADRFKAQQIISSS